MRLQKKPRYNDRYTPPGKKGTMKRRKEELEEVKAMVPDKTQRAVDLACEKGTSNWLTVIPLKDMEFDLTKRKFRGAVRLRHDWPIPDNPSECVCGRDSDLEIEQGQAGLP